MEIKVESMKRCELVTLAGQIDSATAPELEETLLNLVDSGHKNLVLNLADVTFISSPGLKAFLAAQVKARRKVPAGEVVIAEIADPEAVGVIGEGPPVVAFLEIDIAAVPVGDLVPEQPLNEVDCRCYMIRGSWQVVRDLHAERLHHGKKVLDIAVSDLPDGQAP